MANKKGGRKRINPNTFIKCGIAFDPDIYNLIKQGSVKERTSIGQYLEQCFIFYLNNKNNSSHS